MTYLELAEKVLRETAKPMTVSQIWDYAYLKGYTQALGSQGKTPSATLGAQLYVNARDNANSVFGVLGSRPKKFLLKNLTYKKEDLLEEDEETSKTEVVKEKAIGYDEKDLHGLLSYFIYYHMKAYSKTLNHQKSSKKEFGEWVHPDVVACYFPIEDWKTEVYDLSSIMGDAQIALLSFEIKKKLSFANLRESFFQAVSNSSWAHEGYLVAAEISEDQEFRHELFRLSSSFGIGVILLDVEDSDASAIILPAEEEDYLDWNTINKLTINPDFKNFINRVKKDVQGKEIRKELYDSVPTRESLIKKFKAGNVK